MHSYYFVVILRPRRRHDPKGSGALREPDVLYFRDPCFFYDVVDHGWKVVVADLVPAELPEGRRGWLQGRVASRVRVPSSIAHPHVVA